MFGRKKQEDGKDIITILEGLKKGQELQEQARQDWSKSQAGLPGTLENITHVLTDCREQIDIAGKNTERQLKRQCEAIEDLLEEYGSQKALIERCERQIKESEERENMLLSLLCRYQEELGLIEEKCSTMGQDSANDWREQFALFRKSLEGEERQCALEETGGAGERTDYRYHEILDTEDTEEPERDGTVAHCYRPGCVYHGKVITKAQVRAYRLTKNSVAEEHWKQRD